MPFGLLSSRKGCSKTGKPKCRSVHSTWSRKTPNNKDYDSLVTLLINDQSYDFALEYERTLKSVKRYEKILEELENEYQVDCILYLSAVRFFSALLFQG